jgi:Putative transposase
VTFQWKDYRHKNKQKSRTMTVSADEFMRRLFLHTLPPNFQRIRHCGLLANRHRKEKLALGRKLLTHPSRITARTQPIEATGKGSRSKAGGPLSEMPQGRPGPAGLRSGFGLRFLPTTGHSGPPSPKNRFPARLVHRTVAIGWRSRILHARRILRRPDEATFCIHSRPKMTLFQSFQLHTGALFRSFPGRGYMLVAEGKSAMTRR